MNKSRQQGFSGIYVIFALALIAVIGVSIFYALKTHSNKVSSTPVTNHTKATPTIAKNSPLDDWKSVKSATADFTIKYPSNWALTQTTNNGGAEVMSVTSPSQFKLSFTNFSKQSVYGQQTLHANPSGICGACISTNDSHQFDAPGYGSLFTNSVTYGAGGGTTNQLTLTTTSHSEYIVDPHNDNVYVTLSDATYQDSVDRSYEQFTAMSDVQTARQIIESFTY